MASDWNGYLALAKQLAKVGGDSYCRSAISRAYYAAFNVAKDYISQHYSLSGHGSDHSLVRRTLAKNRQGRTAGILGTLHDLRKSADYDTSWSLALAEVNNAISYANEVISRIDKKPRLSNKP